MAKLMVMIDFPEVDYDRLSEAMRTHERFYGVADFSLIKSKDGLEQVSVGIDNLILDRGDHAAVIFELIGVRP